jgi:type I restriction enzyme S subunit
MPHRPLAKLMAEDQTSIDPRLSEKEIFELWSIPAYDTGRPEVLSGGEIGSAKKVVQPGDVLLSRIVPHIRRAWIVGPRNGRAQVASTEWLVFRGAGFDPGYLRHFLLSDRFHRQFMQTVAGVGGSLLRARPREVGRIEVPLPALTEQRRIAAILDQADEVRHKAERSAFLARAVPRAAFRTIFGDVVRNDKGWPSLPLRAISDRIQIGPFGSLLHKSDYVDGGVPSSPRRSADRD